MVDDGSRILAGRYEVGELIGRGGMAEVHIGHDTRLGRTVAIKILRSDLARDPTFQARFRREAQAAASLNHPAIVAVYDTGEDVYTEPTGVVAHVPFIVMEYVEGHTVRDILGDGKAVPIDEAIEITAGVLSALEYSHHAGIVHRDIKPANVMLTPTGAVKVMDFGIARAVADSAATMTQTQAVIGTAQYLSPEQARGETVDARSDLYSTGCLLFELLTGRPPFVGDSPVSVAYQHVREMPPTPSSIAADVPEVLDRITAKALAKERDSRYASAAEFRSDLEAAARGGHVIAPVVAALPLGGAATQVMNPGDSTQVMTGPLAPAWAPTGPGTSVLPTSPEPPDEDEKKNRALMWTLIIIGVLAVAGIITFLLMNRDSTETPEQVTVPTIVGLPESDAVTALTNVGLDYTRQSEPSDTVDSGLVTRSDPAEGTSTDAGSSVTIWVSAGPNSIAIPDVSGLTQDVARQQLEDLGLTVGNVTQEDVPDQPGGRVTRTDPVATQSVSPDQAITLFVASGNVQLDDLRGKTRAEAQQILTALKLTASFTTVETTDAAPDTVFEQARQPGLVQQGSTVDLTVAAAPTTVTIPQDIVGKTFADASAELGQLGLQVTRKDSPSEDFANGTVMTSDPAPGSSVKKSSTVTLTVSTGATAPTTTAPTR